MKFICRSVVPFPGKSKDKNGVEFSWDKIKVYCEVKNETDPFYRAPIFGYPCDVVYSLPNNFRQVVITNGFPVDNWEDLKDCEIEVTYNQWKKPVNIIIRSIDG